MTTYSISLDDVDLALLPLRTHRFNHFLKKEHFQFQVLKTKDEDYPAPEATVFYKCHICAIDVPAAFAREHAASVKHRANARIANVAAARTRALITALPPPSAPQNARFCANCSSIVGGNHEKTKEHRVAVMHDKLLWELMNAYTGDEDSDLSGSDDDDFTEIETGCDRHNEFATWTEINNNKDDKENKGTNLDFLRIGTIKKRIDKEPETQNKDNIHLHSKIKISDATNIETSNHKSPNTSEVTENEVNISAGTDNDITANNATPSTSKATEFNTSSGTAVTQVTNNKEIGTPKTTDTTAKPIEYVEFVNEDNKLVKVYSDHYHSFTRKADMINCQVCRVSFKSGEVYSHMFSLKHLNKMPTYMVDEHCVRKIDEVFSHCIVCNQIVKHTNLAKHYLTINHSQREKQVITDNVNLGLKIDKPAFLDAIVKANDQKTQEVKMPEVKAKMPEAKVKMPEVKVKTPEVKVTNGSNEGKPIDWPVIYPYEVTKQEGAIRCVICDCNVPNNPENRKDHLVGTNHIKNVKQRRETQKQTSFKFEYPYEATKKAGVARCIMCDMKVTISTDNLQGHIDGQNHTTNESNKKMAVKKVFKATNEASVARCIVCNIKVPNTIRNLLDHLFGASHIKKETIRRESQQRASPLPRPVPVNVIQKSAEQRTFETASDTVGRKSNVYFSWV